MSLSGKSIFSGVGLAEGTRFYDRVCQDGEERGRECRVCWLTWWLWRLRFVRNRPFGWAVQWGLSGLLCQLRFGHQIAFIVRWILGSDGVDLVDEDNRGGILFSQFEDISDHAWTFTQILLNELRPDDSDEGSSGAVGDCLGHHCLASTRRTVQENTFGRIDTNLTVELGVG